MGRKVGLLIFSDAYTSNIAAVLADKGAEVLISPAAWAYGMHGTNGEWEERSREAELYLYVSNRTGREERLVFNGGVSGAFVHGRKVASYNKEPEAIITMEIDPKSWQPIDECFEFETTKLQG